MSDFIHEQQPSQLNSSVKFGKTPNGSEKVVGAWIDKEMPLAWRESVYGEGSMFKELLQYQRSWLLSLMGERTSFIEVGCGTCEMGAAVYQKAKFCVQIDINPTFLQVAKEIHEDMAACTTNYFILGEAMDDMNANLDRVMPQDFWSTTRIVCMFMNTLAILDPVAALMRMLELAGPTGTVIAGCYHRDSFERGISEFYSKCSFCGDINNPGTIIDIPNGNLIIPPNYESHWFTAEELRSYVDENKYDVRTEVISVGVYLIITAKKDASEGAM
mmetsp:Transcript_9826/g.9925  ORF Transcript_9826/g.9925 Transcript_9826/m.9925 type:complete len:273 (+) Transcript_9826:231-1049(+)|eukprot:CAMPEP_0182432456 /NCGR_PEP_ID=MMETSP1167-20130531/56468_1 /TAXON_ID=2988 /ORGANISM="Mallomonas Sp, Strain CCMP3275" /LENGTH=272 /DNA_ID=CAMNT_0024619999 /DNA_START=155 /DNA_END=973 /DNA_ORIENTATION=+